MKFAVLCFLLLAVSINAQVNWTGKWYVATYNNDFCTPAGLIELAQDAAGTVTVTAAKWNPLSTKCKDTETSGAIKVESATLATTGLLTIKTKNGKNTEVVITLAQSGADAGSATTVVGGDASTTNVQILGKVSDADISAMKTFLGKFSFSYVAGDNDKCCIPESAEFSEAEPFVIVAKGKWSQTKGCKDQGLDQLDLSKAVATISPKGAGWIHKINNQDFVSAIAQNPTDQGPKLLFIEPKNNIAVCQISASKAGGSALIIIIVIVLILVVAGVGFFLYRRKQQANSGPAYLRA